MSETEASSRPPAPRVVAWQDAPSQILAEISGIDRRGNSPVMIGITGPVGAGKTTLAAALGGTVVSTDSYLPDYETVEYQRRDLPESADLDRLAADLRDLRTLGRARVPQWSFLSHRREGYRDVWASPLVVVEGIHALHGTARVHLDLAVFIDAPAGVRWARWESLEASGKRGWGVRAAKEYFDRVAEPTFLARIAEYRSCAHIVVTNDRNADAAQPRPEITRPGPE